MTLQFELLGESTRKFGENSYIEVTRKRLVDESGEESRFLLITRGFYERDGTKRWTKFVTLPDAAEVRDWLAEALKQG